MQSIAANCVLAFVFTWLISGWTLVAPADIVADFGGEQFTCSALEPTEFIVDLESTTFIQLDDVVWSSTQMQDFICLREARGLIALMLFGVVVLVRVRRKKQR